MKNLDIQRKTRRGEITHPNNLPLKEPIPYRNAEGYSDPTAFFAVQRIARRQAAELPRKRPRTLVARYF